MIKFGVLFISLLCVPTSLSADGAIFRQRVENRKLDLTKAFDEFLVSDNLDSTTSRKIMDASKGLLQLLRKTNREAADPCQNYMTIQFDTWWDEEEGDKWYNMSVARQPTTACNPNTTWLQPKVVDDGDEDVGDYEQLIALCPPMPDCVPHSTRFYTGDDIPRNGQQGIVTLVTNYVGPCKKYSSYKLKLEVKSCPTSADPFNEIYRLPEGCATNNICSISQFGPDNKIKVSNEKTVVG